jgi:ABC-2 type transport system ATP-binding protein
MPTPAIVAEGLERSFGEFRAVRGVNLKVSQGEIYGFLGPNGAGKSTTVRMLCTLLRPTGGKARVAGYDVASETAQVRLRIGVALQEAGLDHSQTGHELLLMQGRLYGLKGAELTARIDDILEMVNLGEAIERRVGTTRAAWPAGSTLPWRWCTTRRYFSSTSRPPDWIRQAGSASGRRFAG